jgi:hypothetical protein
MQCPATAHGADGRGLVPPQMIDFLLTHKIPAKKKTLWTLRTAPGNSPAIEPMKILVVDGSLFL